MSEIKTKPVSPEFDAGFERAFPEGRKLARGRYVWDASKKAMVPAGEREVQARMEISTDTHYHGLQAPDEGKTPIDSRRKHREYMKVKGVALASDYKETWAKAQQDRARFYTEGGGPEEKKARREALERAFYERRRP